MQELAAFTITRNEPLFLKVWCNYYGSVIPPEHLYIIDNSSDDGSVDEVRSLHPTINIVSRPSEGTHDSMFLKHAIERFQQELLQRYACVVFAETDEYLIPSARYHDLADYCRQFMLSGRPYVRAQGWNVVHQIDTEPELTRTPGERILARRNSMWKIQIYDKTLITRVPLVYQRGFHNFYLGRVKQAEHPVDPDLTLLHAWRVSLEEYCRRHQARTDVSREGIESYFRTHVPAYASTGDPHAIGEETPVPDRWRPLLTC